MAIIQIPEINGPIHSVEDTNLRGWTEIAKEGFTIVIILLPDGKTEYQFRTSLKHEQISELMKNSSKAHQINKLVNRIDE